MTTHDQELNSTQDRVDVIGKLRDFSPEFVTMISEFCIGEVYSRPTLPELTKEVVAMVSLISLGSERLKGHFESTLKLGTSKETLVEIITLSAIYLGFPRAIDAMLALHEVVNSLDEKPESPVMPDS